MRKEVGKGKRKMAWEREKEDERKANKQMAGKIKRKMAGEGKRTMAWEREKG